MALGKTLRIPGRRPAPPHPTAPVTSYLILRCKETTLEYQLLIYLLSNHIEINLIKGTLANKFK